MFGGFESQLGHGTVGGPLLSVADEGRRSAAVALRILGGESVESLTVPPAATEKYTYDWRELHRWKIPERRLPPASSVRFRPPSLWEAYRRPLLAGLAVLGLQALLIAGLLAQRAHRHRAEEQVRALNRRLLTAQEDERKVLARELHDDFSQRLARLSIDAARLEYAAAVPLDGARHAPMREELARLSEDVHALAYQLHPSTLDDLGLAEALKVECDHFSRLEAIPVRLDLGQPPPEPSREAALCLFRVAQEGLRNVKRHARASAVDLSCRSEGRGTRMTLRDDGAGFDPDESRRPSLGLAGMRERAALVGGRVEVRSAPGRGTTIAVWVPDESGPA
jgi:signal transduction histidine kinase